MDRMKVDKLKSWYLGRFRQEVGWRKIGREAEIPLINNDGSSGDARKLWPYLEGLGWQPEYDNINKDVCVGFRDHNGSVIITDAGVCTIEVCTRPCNTLWDLNDECNRIFGELVRAAAKEGMKLLGYGIQPITTGRRDLWMPKGRYETGIIPMLGEPVHKVTVTASDQCHVDIGQNEIVDIVNVLNGLSGAIIALMANSPICGGVKNGLRAHRELTWDGFVGFEDRIGLTPRPFTGVKDWIEHLLDQQFLFRFDDEKNRYELRRDTFRQFAGSRGFSERDFFMHEGCLWWSARPRAAYGTVEVRPACQQPPKEHMALQALVLGIVSNIDQAKSLIKGIDWQDLREFRVNAVRDGIRARFRGGSSRSFLAAVIDCANNGLMGRGDEEDAFLAPVIDRLADNKGPADRVIGIFAHGGIPLLIDKFSYTV